MTVPLFMVQDVLSSTKKINIFRIYLYLNARSNGCITLPQTLICKISKDLNIDPKTVKRSLNTLHERNWVRHDKNTGRYYIRGPRNIRKRTKEKSRQGFKINIKTDLNDKIRFKALLCGAFINNLGRYKVYQTYVKKHRGRDKEWLKGCSVPTSRPRMFWWWPVAANYIAKILDISISTAHEYRKIAEQYGFIEVRRYRRELSAVEIAARKEKGGKSLAMIRRQGERLVIDGTHWVRSTVIEYRRIPRNKKPKIKLTPPISDKVANFPLNSSFKEIPF